MSNQSVVKSVNQSIDIYRFQFQAKFFQTSCRWNFEAEEALEGQENNKIYGYIDGRRDKNTEGLLYLGMVKLPEDLKESYVSFCKSWFCMKINLSLKLIYEDQDGNKKRYDVVGD